jgi:hypothetical protein
MSKKKHHLNGSMPDLSHWWKHIQKKKQKQILMISAVVLLCVLFGIAWAVSHKQQPPTDEPIVNATINEKPKKQKKEKPSVLPRRIDGLLVAPDDANKVPACVMIENAAFAGVRPQSGLSQASVIYEVIVEGGITRFMAVYAGEKTNEVGPVRSARDTYLEFASEYNCAYYHAGGSYTALLALSQFGMRDVDGLREPKYFWRNSAKYAPHNLFTSTDNLYAAIDDHSWSTGDAPNYAPWKFQDAVDSAQRPTPETEQGVNLVRIEYGGAYNVEYSYTAQENYFERTNGGSPHTDAVNGQRLTAKNIVIQHVGEGISVEGKGRVNWPVTGEGAVEIFHDGQVYKGTWKKADRLGRTQFFDAQGKEIPFVRGNTWVEIVPPHITVHYQ